MLKFTIPIEPRTKKNSQQIMMNRKTHIPFVMQSSTYKQYEKDVAIFMPKLKEPISNVINIKYTFFKGKHTRCDLNGLIQCIDDVLVKYGIIQDDNYKVVAGHDGSRVYVDKLNPRTEIEITEIT